MNDESIKHRYVIRQALYLFKFKPTNIMGTYETLYNGRKVADRLGYYDIDDALERWIDEEDRYHIGETLYITQNGIISLLMHFLMDQYSDIDLVVDISTVDSRILTVKVDYLDRCFNLVNTER